MATLNINDRIYKEFKKFCNEKKLIMSAVAETALENYMKANKVIDSG